MKINKSRKILYNKKTQKNLSMLQIKETEKNLLELEKSLYNLQKYYDYDDTECQVIRDIRKLFSEVDQNYYNPIRTKSAFNGNYIEYESKGDKDKNSSPKKYLDIIIPYLSDMINNHKTRREWKIQLTMQNNFISCKDSEETRTMYTNSHNIEIMMGNKNTWNYQKTFWISFKKIFKKFRRTNERKGVCSW